MGNHSSILCKDDRYPGLKHTAKYIGMFFPKCDTYIEPFAGLARTAKYARCNKMVLNDRSKHSNKTCKKLFPNAIVTNEDFTECIQRWDSPDNFFLIDYPWRTDFYEQKTITFCDRTAKEYESILEELCIGLKAKWIVCTLHTKKLNFKYTKVVEDFKPRIFGFKAKTRLYSNDPIDTKMDTLDSYFQ